MSSLLEQRLDKIVSLMRSDRSADAPADAIKYAKGLMRSRISAAEPGIVERIVAVLKMHLEPGKPAFGERSASAASARQMLFDAGIYAVDIRITKTGTSYELRGQIIGGETAGGETTSAEIRLTKRTKTLQTRTDEFGGFRFEKLSAGDCEIAVVLDGKELVIPHITVE